MTRKTRRTRNGQREKLCGGEVSWDGRKSDEYGLKERTIRTLEVWVRANLCTDDCGQGTNELVAALKAKAEKAGHKNVTVRECWDC
jgi:hypothetical protein